MLVLYTGNNMETMETVYLVLMGMFVIHHGKVFGVEPIFDVQVVNVTVREGDIAILPCSVKHLGNHKVAWTDQWSTLLTLDDRRLISDTRISIERPYTRDWNLHIRRIEYKDRGQYTCQINTNPVKSNTVMLIVQVPSKIIDELSSINHVVREGETVGLVCNVTGVPTPEVKWYKLPSHDGIFTERERIGTVDEMLLIHNVSRYNAGTYTCHAFNGVEPAVTRTIKVFVEFAPEVSMISKRVGQSLGKDTFLECMVSAYPHAVTTWKKNDRELNAHDKEKYSVEMYSEGDTTIILTLRVQNIEPADFGRYACYAYNSKGEDEETMVLYEYMQKPTTTTRTLDIQPTTSKRSNPDGDIPVFDMEPSFDVQAVNVTVREGDTAVLPCAVKHKGAHKVVWTDQRLYLLTLDDRRIIDDTRISIERPYTRDWNLHIRRVEYKDRGQYTCQINTNPVKTKTVRLIVQVPSKIIDELSSRDQIDVREGETVTLVCNVTGVPTPEVKWFKLPSQEGLSTERERIGTVGEILRIHNVSRYNAGTYACHASNGVEPVVARTIKVFVEFAPEVSMTSKRVGQSLGKDTFLECMVSAYPHAVTTWKKNDRELNAHDKEKYSVEMYSEGDTTIILTLRVQNIEPADFGRYACYAYNSQGEDGETMVLYEYMQKPTTTTRTLDIQPTTSKRSNPDGDILVFDMEPSFDVQAVNVTVREGDTAVLPCALEHKGAHKVVWTDQWSTLLTLDDRRIMDDTRISIEHPHTCDWNLHIRRVEYKDRGQYTCQINTNPVKTKTVRLIVQVPSKIIDELSSRDQIVREGETVTLVCNVTGVPTPEVKWFKLPSQEGISTERERIGTVGEMLRIHNVSRYNAGIYACHAFNGVEPVVARTIKVFVEFAPEVLMTSKRVGQSLGKDTFLECMVSAYPHAVTTWKKNDRELNAHDKEKYSVEMYSEGDTTIILTLRVQNIEPADFGRYACYAYNSKGEDEETMVLYEYMQKPTTTTRTLDIQPTTSKRSNPDGDILVFGVEPIFDMQAVNVTVREGDTAVLPCAMEHLGKYKVVWTDQWSNLLTLDVRRIMDDTRISIERPYTREWNLHIRRVEYKDRGQYTCQINTIPVKTKTVMLIVQVPSKIINELSTRDQTVREGQNFEMFCNATGVPAPTVTWYKLPTEDGFSREKERIGVGESLVVHNVSRYSAGTYACHAFNGVEPAVTRTIKVFVEFAPEVLMPVKRISQYFGKDIILDCTISAYPQHVATWKKNGRELNTRNREKYSIDVYSEGTTTIILSLRVQSIEPADFGRYTCYANNSIGEDEETMVLYEYMPHHTTTAGSLIIQPTTTKRPYVPPQLTNPDVVIPGSTSDFGDNNPNRTGLNQPYLRGNGSDTTSSTGNTSRNHVTISSLLYVISLIVSYLVS